MVGRGRGAFAVLCVGAAAIVGLGAGGERATASPAAAAPLARFVVPAGKVEPGDEALVVVQLAKPAPTGPTTCALTLVGAGMPRSGPFPARMSHAFALWTWLVPPNAGRLHWSAIVECSAGRRHQTLSSPIEVSARRAGAGGLVWPRSMRVAVSSRPPAIDQGEVGSRDGSTAYGDSGAVCLQTSSADGACPGHTWGYRHQNGTWSLLSARGFAYRTSMDYAAWATASPSIGDIAWFGPASSRVGVVVSVAGDNAVVSEYDLGGTGGLGQETVHADAYLRRAPLAPPAPYQIDPSETAMPATDLPPVPAPAATGDTVPPSKPDFPRYVGGEPNAMSYQWDPSTDNVAVAGYLIYRDGKLLGTEVGPRYRIWGLKCSEPLNLSVAAYDPAGNVSPQVEFGGTFFQASCFVHTPPRIWTEQAAAILSVSYDYHDPASIMPVFISAGQTVRVSCRVTDSDGSVWYRLNQDLLTGHYARANGFVNGPDLSVPVC